MTHYLLKEDGSYAGVESMSQLGAILATMPRFHRCQVSAFVDALVQTSSLEDKEKLYQQALDAYYASNQSIKAALKAVVLSEVFNGRPH
jgi:regulatory protein YycI of two-component signal transduction system YycFG